MLKRIFVPLFATLLMTTLVAPALASASAPEGPDLVTSISGEGSVSAGNPQLGGRFGVSWENIGNAPATGTTVVTINFPASMTTSGAQLAATCSPVSYEHGSGC